MEPFDIDETEAIGLLLAAANPQLVAQTATSCGLVVTAIDLMMAQRPQLWIIDNGEEIDLEDACAVRCSTRASSKRE